MQKDVLRELAIVLTERVRQNATIDWTIKESVRAKLKVIVRNEPSDNMVIHLIWKNWQLKQ